jgi:uncharacterized protein with FMN-binding domain
MSEKNTRLVGAALSGLALVGAGCTPATTEQAPAPEEAMMEKTGDAMMEDSGSVSDAATGTSGDAMMEPKGDMMEPKGDAMMASSKYKDGTYTADGDYTYHSGNERVTITIMLKNDVITDTTFAGTPSVPPSGKFMDMFAGGYKQLVVGKNIDEVQLDKVSGSSRTPIGFNDALAKIKAQAAL